MDGNKKNEDINVTPYMQGVEVKWQLEIVKTGEKGGPGSYPVLNIPHGQKDTHVVIRIKNPEGFDYKFAKDGAALWVSAGTQDPTGPSTYPDQVPTGSIKTKDGDKTLQFANLNKGDPVTLHYTLNFVSGNQQSSTLDPIIENGGGGGPGRGLSDWAAFALVGFMLIGLVAYLVKRNARDNVVRNAAKQDPQQPADIDRP